METLRAAYAKAKENDGAPGIDGVTFEAIEQCGGEAFLEQIRDELTGVIDLRAYFDNVRHDVLRAKVAKRMMT
jgi:hypothetical protein